jgi:hypothetical protein
LKRFFLKIVIDNYAQSVTITSKEIFFYLYATQLTTFKGGEKGKAHILIAIVLQFCFMNSKFLIGGKINAKNNSKKSPAVISPRFAKLTYRMRGDGICAKRSQHPLVLSDPAAGSRQGG